MTGSLLDTTSLLDAPKIDGSIYLSHAHHPVDVTTIRFGEVAEGALSVEIEAVLDLEFEGLDDYERTPWTLHSFVGVR